VIFLLKIAKSTKSYKGRVQWLYKLFGFCYIAQILFYLMHSKKSM